VFVFAMVDVTRLVRLTLVGTLIIVASAAAANIDAQSTQAIPPDLYAGLIWRCVGPFDGGPVASVAGIPGEAGVYLITTPSGGAWKTIDGGDTWSPDKWSPASLDPGSGADPHRWIDPANPRRIVRTDAQGIAVSLDGGVNWVTSHNLPIAEVAHLTPRSAKTEATVPPRSIAGKPVNVSAADPARPGLVFAGTNDSVYVSFDDGIRWESLRLNLPSVAINDLDIQGNDLVAATQGRSVWVLDDISPLRQLSAASASAAAILFKPADAVLSTPGSSKWSPGSSDPGNPGPEGPGLQIANLDYYLGASSSGEIKLEILDAGGRVVHAATSAPPDTADRWLPVMRSLSAAPGHHRVVWNLRVDPPPAQKHRYAQFARALFEEMPPDPDGPPVLPGTYRVRLTVAGKPYAQPFVVHNDSRVGEAPATVAAQRRQFDLALKMYDAMQIAHREFMRLGRVRAQLRSLLSSSDEQVAAAATDLDARLVQLDGSDWTDLIIPDEDPDEFDPEEAEEQGIKHPDFIPPKPVSISKDYDDPTSILGRHFANVEHAPALATVSVAFGGMLTKTIDAAAAPDATAVADYERSCRQLSGVLEAWRAVNAQDLPRLNAELARRKLPPLPIATSVSTIACGSK
jgi:hypothetical protein